jgi:hypothetical protein
MATVLEQLACENPKESPLVAAIAAPIRSIFGLSKHESLFLYAWVLLILLWIILYYLVPLSFLNSSNGFRSGSRTLIWSLVIFALVIIGYVLWARKSACASKRDKAEYFVKGQRPNAPAYLSRGIERVQSLEKNRGRSPTSWRPQSPYYLEE